MPGFQTSVTGSWAFTKESHAILGRIIDSFAPSF